MKKYVEIVLFAALLNIPLVSFANPQVAPTELSWRLENPFRLFRDPDDFEKLRIPANVSISEWFSGIAHEINGDFLPYRRTHWDPTGSRNSTGFYPPSYVFPKSHRIVMSWKGAPAGRCNWEIGSERRLNTSCEMIKADIKFNYRAPEKVPVKVTSISNGTVQHTTVLIRDKLILALGDSYTAGQGAPDRPAELDFNDSVAIADPFKEHITKEANVWFPKLAGGREVEWWDGECNRSLLAWPVLTALKIASDLADEAEQNNSVEQYSVTFLSYACSGAEFYDGVFTAQKNPPGVAKADQPSQGSAVTYVQNSQIYAAGHDLCDTNSRPQIIYHGLHAVRRHHCKSPRVPDIVLLSVGGNDAGFSKVIMHNMLPLVSEGNNFAGRAGLLAFRKLLGTVSVEESRERLNAIAGAYQLLGRELQDGLRVDSKSLYFMAYANPLMRPASANPKPGSYCGLEMRSGMEAARMVAYPLSKPWWHFWITSNESKKTVEGMVTPLQDLITKSIPSGARMITGHLSAFDEHGLCADAPEFEDDQDAKQVYQAIKANVDAYGLPRQEIIPERGLEHLAEWNWRPYDTSQKRWIRTPNDSLQTQTRKTLASSIVGAFHPTGAGYAAMADAAWAEITKAADEVPAN